MDQLFSIVILAGVILIAIIAIGMVFSRLYKRSTKERSFVRTGFGGQKVILNGGALVLPVLHEIIHVNMNTLRLEVRRVDEQSLITKDRMRVDVTAAFYVRVKPTEESIADAAQTLGPRTLEPDALKELVEGKFVDALRSVAAEMTMSDLQDQRTSFVQKVQAVVSEDLRKNGLELETVSLTGLDQTKRDFFNPQNAFDAEGLTRLTEEIESRRMRRNEIEQDAEVSVRTKNLEAERSKLELAKQEQYAKLMQEQEIAIRTAEQMAEVAMLQAGKHREAEEAKILSQQQIDQARINAERLVKEKDVEKLRAVQTVEIASARAVEVSCRRSSARASSRWSGSRASGSSSSTAWKLWLRVATRAHRRAGTWPTRSSTAPCVIARRRHCSTRSCVTSASRPTTSTDLRKASSRRAASSLIESARAAAPGVDLR